MKHGAINQNEMELLSGTSLFSQLNFEDIERVTLYSKLMTIKVGDPLIRQGDPSDTIIIILSGLVSVFVDQLEMPHVLTKGRILGEVTFFTGQPRQVTGICKEETKVLIIDHTYVNELIQTDPVLGLKLYRGFTLEILSKLKEMSDHLINFVLRDLSKQFAHDIRSPLAALRALTMSFSECHEMEKELLKLIVNRIDDIALLSLGRSTETKKMMMNHQFRASPAPVVDIVRAVHDLVLEKKIQYKNVNHLLIQMENAPVDKPKSQRKQVVTHLVDFQRILSNLIDNAVQAIAIEGWVKVRLKSTRGSLNLSVSDNGSGIPKEVRSLLGVSKVSYGKEQGNGIGLFDAYQKIGSWGGSIKIKSKLKQGTTITISLPLLDSDLDKSSI